MRGGDERIIDIAEKYGYRSPTAFNRAFQSFHGIAPSSVKDEGVSVKSFSPIVFKIAVKGATEMNYRIETKEAFRIIGVSAPLDNVMPSSLLRVSIPHIVRSADLDLSKPQYQERWHIHIRRSEATPL